MSVEIVSNNLGTLRLNILSSNTTLNLASNSGVTGLAISQVNTVLNLAMGTPGPKGDAGSSVLVYVAGAAISGHTVVTSNAAGEAIVADPTNLAHASAVIGITQNSAVLLGNLNIQNSGYITHSGWNFTPQQPVFLSTMGALSQTLPVGALYSKVVGVAVSATAMVVSLQPAVVL